MAKTPSPSDGTRLLADVLGFGWTLPAAIAAGAGLGWLADRLFHTFPVVTIVLGLAGAAAGFWQVWREMTRIARGGGPEPPESSG